MSEAPAAPALGARGASAHVAAAMVPVVVGVALIRPRTINWGNSALCLIVALALQVGTNYANDYSDVSAALTRCAWTLSFDGVEARVLVEGSKRRLRVILACRCGGTVPRVEDLVVAGRDRRHGDLGRMVLHRGAATVRVLRLR